MPKLNSPEPFLTVTSFLISPMTRVYSPSTLANTLPVISAAYTLYKTSMLKVMSALDTINELLVMLIL